MQMQNIDDLVAEKVKGCERNAEIFSANTASHHNDNHHKEPMKDCPFKYSGCRYAGKSITHEGKIIMVYCNKREHFYS